MPPLLTYERFIKHKCPAIFSQKKRWLNNTSHLKRMPTLYGDRMPIASVSSVPDTGSRRAGVILSIRAGCGRCDSFSPDRSRARPVDLAGAIKSALMAADRLRQYGVTRPPLPSAQPSDHHLPGSGHHRHGEQRAETVRAALSAESAQTSHRAAVRRPLAVLVMHSGQQIGPSDGLCRTSSRSWQTWMPH